MDIPVDIPIIVWIYQVVPTILMGQIEVSINRGSMDGLLGKIPRKWMMTGGTPISGNPQMDQMGQVLLQKATADFGRATDAWIGPNTTG